jgi:hypothetical protein
MARRFDALSQRELALVSRALGILSRVFTPDGDRPAAAE